MFEIFIGLIMATNLMSFSASEDEIRDAFAKVPYSPEHHFIPNEKGTLHYITTDDSLKPPVLLIHGSPGSWDNWLDILTQTDFLNHYYAIAVDRPGYNQTTLGNGYSLQEQAEFLAPLIERYCQPCVVVGHSYGGALAVQTALDNPEAIKAFVSVAGTVADSLQHPRFYNYILRYTPLQWIMAPEFMTSNKEMMSLEHDLHALANQLSAYSGKAALIQGGEDMLVDPRSARYTQSKLTQANVRLWTREEMNHFVIWSDKDLVLDALQWAEAP